MALISPKTNKSLQKKNNDMGVPILWLGLAIGQGATGIYFAVQHIDNFFGILASIYLLGTTAAIIGYHFFAAHKKPTRR